MATFALRQQRRYQSKDALRLIRYHLLICVEDELRDWEQTEAELVCNSFWDIDVDYAQNKWQQFDVNRTLKKHALEYKLELCVRRWISHFEKWGSDKEVKKKWLKKWGWQHTVTG